MDTEWLPGQQDARTGNRPDVRLHGLDLDSDRAKRQRRGRRAVAVDREPHVGVADGEGRHAARGVRGVDDAGSRGRDGAELARGADPDARAVGREACEGLRHIGRSVTGCACACACTCTYINRHTCIHM
jgi:hypothetical protein